MDICCWAGVVMCVLDVFVSVNKKTFVHILLFFSSCVFKFSYFHVLDYSFS